MSSRGAELTGLRVVVTRAPHQAGALREVLEAHGAQVISLPTIRIAEPEDWSPVDEALAAVDGYDAVLIGSKNAVDAVRGRGFPISVLVVAVGRKTKAALAADPTTFSGEIIVPKTPTAEGMVAALEARLAPLSGRRFLFLRAPEGRETAIRLLTEAGALVDARSVYRIVRADPPDARTVEAIRRADVLTFMSGETLGAFIDIVPGARAMLDAAVVAVIGPIARARAQDLGVRVDVVPKERSVEGLVEAIIQHRAHLDP